MGPGGTSPRPLLISPSWKRVIRSDDVPARRDSSRLSIGHDWSEPYRRGWFGQIIEGGHEAINREHFESTAGVKSAIIREQQTTGEKPAKGSE